MRRHGIAVLDSVTPTNAFMALQVDSAHYTQANVASAAPVLLLTMLCTVLEEQAGLAAAALSQREEPRRRSRRLQRSCPAHYPTHFRPDLDKYLLQ